MSNPEKVKEDVQNIFLQLGDIIRIEAPTEDILNNQTFFIDYIDRERAKLININNFKEVTLKMNEEGVILPVGSIVSIDLLKRKEVLGYARQNNLITNTWVNIYFDGDIPFTITGKITNLEEDMIELTTIDKDVLYIDFDYKGIPEDLHIKLIQIRDAPITKQTQTLDETEMELPPADSRDLDDILNEALDSSSSELAELEGDGDVENSEEGEEGEEGEVVGQDEGDEQKQYIIRASDWKFGNTMQPVQEVVDVGESQQRFNIELQTVEMLDNLLAKIPVSKRSNQELDQIHLIIERFKQLRVEFSQMDNHNNIIDKLTRDDEWKPLVDDLMQFKKKLYWILPVATNIKKLYDNANVDGSIVDDYQLFDCEKNMKEMEELLKNFKELDSYGEPNRYLSLMKDLNPYFTPFSQTNPDSVNQVITTFPVHDQLNTIIDNLGDFESSVYEGGIRHRRFMLQKYNTPLTRLKTTSEGTASQMLVERVDATTSDILELKSIVTLPAPAIRFSHINLPSTSILERTNLNEVFLNYWQFLKTRTAVTNIIVNSNSDALAVSAGGADNNNPFDKIKNYVLNQETDILSDAKPDYRKYLNSVVSKTSDLFNEEIKFLKTNKINSNYFNEGIGGGLGTSLSIHGIIQKLEPFNIYARDVNYKLYKNILKWINLQIKEYRVREMEGRSLMNLNKKKALGKSTTPSFAMIFSLIANNLRLRSDIFQETYDLKEKGRNSSDSISDNDSRLGSYTNSEALTDMTKLDFGQVFHYGVALANISLMMPINGSPQEQGEQGEDSSSLSDEATRLGLAIKKANNENKCSTFVIAKQYENVDEMMKDNGKIIYFDKKFDDTNYGLLDDANTAMLDKEFQKAQKTLTTEDYQIFVTNKLESSFKYTPQDAAYMAETLIEGMKKVVDGNIAIVRHSISEDANSNQRYYKWDKNRWVEDDQIDASNFTNNPTILCQLQEQCINVEKKYNNKCESYDLNRKELSKTALNEVINEFDSIYKKSREQLEKHITKEYDYYFSIAPTMKKMHDIQLFKYNYFQYNLGLLTGTDTGVLSESPHMKLFNMILGFPNFPKKQMYLFRFATRFTREANSTDESPNRNFWRYCIQTNIQLMPSFMFKLASSYLEDEDMNKLKYLKTMDEVLKNHGVMSDDGNFWVDKYSGYTIQKIGLSVQEAYQQGFRVSTREVMDKDEGDVILDNLKEPVKYSKSTPEMLMAMKIITAVSQQMRISIENQREFILNLVHSIFPRIMPTDKNLKDLQADNEKNKKKNIPFPQLKKEMYNSSVLYLTLSAFLVAAQVSIPSVTTNHTFPGCVASFKGFPLDGAGDLSSLNYLACVVYKLKSHSIEPWSVLSGKKVEYIATKIESIIKANIFFLNENVVRKIDEKRRYLLNNPDKMSIPDEHSLLLWQQFLPPIQSFQIKDKNIINITKEFKHGLVRDMKEGFPVQQEKILIVESKIILYSLAIQQKIQGIVNQTQNNMVLTDAIHQPYVQNACCNKNEKTAETTVQYFNRKSDDILKYNDIVVQLSHFMSDIRSIGQSPFLFCKKNTKSKYLPLGNEFTEETIYMAFIRFCRFQSLVPLSTDLLSICPVVKPNYLNTGDSINNKIRKLKEHGEKYDNQKMLVLLEIVNRQNIVHVTMEDHQTMAPQKILDLLDSIQSNPLKSNKIIPKKFVKMFIDTIDTDNSVLTKNTKEMNAMIDYLDKVNREMKTDVLTFLRDYSDGAFPTEDTNRKWRNIKSIVNNGMKWLDFESTRTVEKISDEFTYNSFQHVKTYLHNMTKDFPNMILNKVDYTSDGVKIPTYWKLSQNHATNIKDNIKDYYSPLKQFYADATLTKMLTSIQNRTMDLMTLMNLTPYFTDIMEKGKRKYSVFEKEMATLLFEFYFLKTLVTYIQLSEDKAMLQGHVQVSVAQEAQEAPEMTIEDEMADITGMVAKEEDGQGQGEQGIDLVEEGNQDNLKKQTSRLLFTFLSMWAEHKANINISYETIEDIIFKVQQKEKDTFTDALKSLNPERRQIENILKTLKMGDWAKGMSKAVTNYDGENYDQEQRQFEETQKYQNRMVRKNADANDDNLADLVENAVNDARIQQEIDEDNNLDPGEDYMNDGEYLNEANENDDDYPEDDDFENNVYSLSANCR